MGFWGFTALGVKGIFKVSGFGFVRVSGFRGLGFRVDRAIEGHGGPWGLRPVGLRPSGIFGRCGSADFRLRAWGLGLRIPFF